MSIPFSWLQSYFPKKLKLQSVIDKFVQAGIEIEDIRKPAALPDTIVVGKVLSLNKHPNADRLSVCVVQCGDGIDRTIVCGAPNVEAGKIVAVALPGTQLPRGLVITKAEIRGIP